MSHKLISSQHTTHHFQQGYIIPQWTQDSNEWNKKHDDSQNDQDYSRSQKHSLQRLEALSLHLSIDADGQDEAAYQLETQWEPVRMG